MVLLALVVLVPPVKAPPSQTYYELAELGYIIKADRTLNANERFTFVNTSPTSVKITVNKTVPTLDVENVRVWDATGDLTYQLERGAKSITISFETRWIGRGEHYTYNISYTASGLVSGRGAEYRASLGGVTAGDSSYENYVVTVEGPTGTSFFLSSEPSAELIRSDPPTVRYSTSIGAHETFEGLVVRFYLQPVYYKLTLTEHFFNRSTEVSKNVTFDTIIFTHSPSQFAAFAGASLPVKTMYVDDESNWHGVFDVGDIQPGGSKNLDIELIYVENVYTPDISKNDVGTIADVPAELSPYLEAREYWETNDPIKRTAYEVVGTETNAYEVARKIVEYVSNYVTYEVTLQRKGALQTFLDRRGDCDGFSDLTIALSRAVGLPARMDFGWGYRENLVGHAWVEFYLPSRGWQPADPTWAKTSGDYLFKLDPIHLLRYVCGKSSSKSVSRYWGSVQVGIEMENLVSLGESEAAQILIRAGESTIGIASSLLASHPDDTLNQELAHAREKLERARGATDENAILLAQKAIEHANVVIRALGKPYEAGFQLLIDPIYLVLILAAIASAGVAAIWIHKRRA